MFKKTLCVLFAALMLVCLCACSNKGANNQSGTAGPTPTPAAAHTAQPADEGPANLTTESAEGDSALSALDHASVLLRFTGAVEAEVTVEQLLTLDLYDYSESMGEDTPVFSGPLVRDVLALIGADNVSTVSVIFGGGQGRQDFVLNNLDLDTAIFGVLSDGKPIPNRSVLICKTLDGFNYIQYVDAPMELS